MRSDDQRVKIGLDSRGSDAEDKLDNCVNDTADVNNSVWLSMSVTELVHFACRSGDLELRSESGPSALEGIRAHQKVQRNRQKQLGENYQVEVAIETDYQWRQNKIVLRGRIDGIQIEPAVTIEEIKSCYLPPHELPESTRSVQLAQLKVYAWLWLQSSGKTFVNTRLTWLDVTQNQEYSEFSSFTLLELDEFVESALNRYCHWFLQIESHKKQLVSDCQALTFPFENFRGGQRQFSEHVFRAIRDSKNAALNAPTGIGKSMGSLFPAYKALGEGLIQQIAFLTAKTTGRLAALQACQLLNEKKVSARVLVLNAKGKTCFCKIDTASNDFQIDNSSVPIKNEPFQTHTSKATDKLTIDTVNPDEQPVQLTFESESLKSNCNGVEQCKYSIGFYDRLPAAMQECLQHQILDNDAITDIATEFNVCPFELSMQMVTWSDIVIADYNYIFEPQVGLSHFIENGEKIACLIDEAHNLVDRSRSMYSAQLAHSELQELMKFSQSEKSFHYLLSDLLDIFERWSLSFHAQIETHSYSKSVKETLAVTDAMISDLMLNVVKQIHWFSRQKNKMELPAMYFQWLNALSRFRLIYEHANQHQFFYDEKSLKDYKKGFKKEPGIEHNNERLKEGLLNTQVIRHECLNAGNYLSQIFEKLRSVVLFSGTLNPPDFIFNSLGLDNRTAYFDIPSPFTSEQSLVMVPSYISTRYADRQDNIPKVVASIKSFISVKKGNYLICFPSYSFMQQVNNVLASELREELSEELADFKVYQQTSDMNHEDKQTFIERFFTRSNVIGFVVMGGTFTEGIDFLGDALAGVIIVGTGMPQVSPLQNAIKNNTDKNLEQSDKQNQISGFDLAYRYPGLQRVLQAAGRLIRSEQDKGAILLLDKNFATRQYRECFPKQWQLISYSNDTEMLSLLDDFWNT